MDQYQQQQGLIIRFEDIKIAMRAHKKFLKEVGTSYKEMEKMEILEIEKNLLLTEDQRKFSIKNIEGSYMKADKNLFKQMFTQYIQQQILGSQILLKNVYKVVNEKIDEFEEEFKLGLNARDKFEIGFEVNKIIFQSLATFSTFSFDKKELELMKEKAEKNLEKNRNFGREVSKNTKKEK